MRPDALGLWWRDEPVVKQLKGPKPKRTPPEPVWLRPDYLPGLEEALKFDVHVMSDAELWQAKVNGEKLLFDVESYWNYFLVTFRSYHTGHVVYLEMGADGSINREKLKWIMHNFTLIGFNSDNYDIPILTLALAGKSCAQLKAATNKMIKEEWRPYEVLKSHKVKQLKELDHIDLIEVAPLQASLKIYGGRLHVPKMQDLPFEPETILTSEQMAIIRWYNINDLTQTAFLYQSLLEQISLRESMSARYGIDLRSHSDAQVAEAVIGHELTKINHTRPQKPVIAPGTAYYYRVPHFIQYETQLMNSALDIVRRAKFVVEEHGGVGLPKEIAKLQLQIANNRYTMGIGGLHSTETKVALQSGPDMLIVDRDVTSYYPRIILNQQLYPSHLGPAFLRIYKMLVDQRVAAKEAGNKTEADSLKITVNGSFGKLGSKYSILYSPDLLIQVTITGQLALLMLIEMLELRGIHVISANTDGVVIACPKSRQAELNYYIKEWERRTNFETEETQYLAYYGRDVNNYIAVKKKQDKETKQWLDKPDGVKAKGAYANPWNDPKMGLFRLHKKPVTTVCIEAVEALLTKNIPIEDTIRSCKDIRKFISVRKVKGGAVKVHGYAPPPAHNSRQELIKLAGFIPVAEDQWNTGDGELSVVTTEQAYTLATQYLSTPKNTEYLGVAIRWYYATNQTGEMIYASSGNKVPRSDGAKPLLTLPEQFPEDVDFDWYEKEAGSILQNIAYIT
jgi:hypothetical protein